MRAEVRIDGLAVADKLQRAPAAWRAGIKRVAFSAGAVVVEDVKRHFLSGPTSATQTEIRTDHRRRSYGHQVADLADGIALDVGPIKPSAHGQVPIQSRVFEGFNAQGVKVPYFDIVAKNVPYLIFPIRTGPGLAKSNISGWVKTRKVRLYPRPTFDYVEEKLTPELSRRGAEVFRDVT